ncbi:MAG: hypothetical protein OXF20_10675 [Gammaproteobacteria bacterium]|nr:hypothetical protein [Gammaproteobacteria bacterium]
METGAAMPRIRPSGQVRNTPAPRPTESRPGADKKISIYGLGKTKTLAFRVLIVVESISTVAGIPNCRHPKTAERRHAAPSRMQPFLAEGPGVTLNAVP